MCSLHLSQKPSLIYVYIGDGILPSYLGTLKKSHYTYYMDPYQPSSIVEAHWWILITCSLKNRFQPGNETSNATIDTIDSSNYTAPIFAWANMRQKCVHFPWFSPIFAAKK